MSTSDNPSSASPDEPPTCLDDAQAARLARLTARRPAPAANRSHPSADPVERPLRRTSPALASKVLVTGASATTLLGLLAVYGLAAADDGPAPAAPVEQAGCALPSAPAAPPVEPSGAAPATSVAPPVTATVIELAVPAPPTQQVAPAVAVTQGS